MDISLIPFFDLFVICILLYSAWRASLSGFVYQIFGILAWIGSLIVTLKTPQFFKDTAQNLISLLNYPQLNVFSLEITIAITFLISLFLFLLIAKFFVTIFAISTSGFINRTLGFAWGLLRGLLAVILIYIVLVSYYPKFIDIQHNSLFLPTIESISDRLRSLNIQDFIN